MNTSNQSRKGLNKGEFINFIYIHRDKIIGADKSVKYDADKTTKSDIERALNMVLRSIQEAVKNDHDINLVGFGSFSIKSRAAREGHNPKTGEKINIPAHKQLVFKAGKVLKDSLQ